MKKENIGVEMNVGIYNSLTTMDHTFMFSAYILRMKTIEKMMRNLRCHSTGMHTRWYTSDEKIKRFDLDDLRFYESIKKCIKKNVFFSNRV